MVGSDGQVGASGAGGLYIFVVVESLFWSVCVVWWALGYLGRAGIKIFWD